MSASINEEFDIAAYLEKFGALEPVGSVDIPDGEEVVLNPADDRTPFAGAGLNTIALFTRKYTSMIPPEFYPMIFKTAYSRSRSQAYARAVGALKAGKALYDEGSFDRPPGAVLECRHKLASLMKASGVESMRTRFFGETEFSVRTVADIFDGVEVGCDFLSTFTQNFMQLGCPLYRAAGVERDDAGFQETLKERTRSTYRSMPTGREWTSYHRYLDVLFAFAASTEAERKALFESMVSADAVSDINVSLGGRIRNNTYCGTGRYPAMSLRYAGELALLLVKHGVVKPRLDIGTLELTDGGRRLIEFLPASCDDPDKYGHFHDFSLNPPAIPRSEAAAVEAWLMDYFTKLKAAGEAFEG